MVYCGHRDPTSLSNFFSLPMTSIWSHWVIPASQGGKQACLAPVFHRGQAVVTDSFPTSWEIAVCLPVGAHQIHCCNVISTDGFDD